MDFSINTNKKYLSSLLLFGILLFSDFATASDDLASTSDTLISASNDQQQSCDESTSQCVETGKWRFSVSLGIGLRSNPLIESNNIPLVILPEFSYYGDRFFIENLDVGYTLFDYSDSSVNLIATPNFDSVFFNRWDPGNLFVNLSSISDGSISTPDQTEDNFTQINPGELSKRKFSYLAGIEYNQDFEDSLLQISLLNDVTGTHSGKEIRFAYTYSFSQPFSTTLGFTWKDKKLTDYYYGVDLDEIVDDRGAYQPNASFNPFLRISLNSKTSNNDNWRFSLEYQKLDSQITNSPISSDDYVVTFYVGKRFSFD